MRGKTIGVGWGGAEIEETERRGETILVGWGGEKSRRDRKEEECK